MLSFKQFFQEDFHSSSIIAVEDRKVSIPVSFDKFPFAKFSLTKYLGLFLKDSTILTGGYLRGALFKVDDFFYNICWEDYLHTKILTLFKNKVSHPDFIGIYKKMNMILKGDTIPEDWCFTYYVIKSSLGATLRRDVLDIMKAQKNVNTLFGLTDSQWKVIRDNAD